MTTTLEDRKEKAVEWLSYQYKGEFSPLGKTVAALLDQMWGLHNINRTSLGKVDWSNDYWIEITCDKPMGTVDNNDLTRIVVYCHQLMLRLDIAGLGPGYIKLIFHQRASRERDKYWNWCPTIEDHVKLIKPAMPAVDEVAMDKAG